MASFHSSDHLLHTLHGSSFPIQAHLCLGLLSPINLRVTPSGIGAIDHHLHAPHFSCCSNSFLLSAHLQMVFFRTSDHLFRAFHGSSFPIQVQHHLGSSSPIHWRVPSSGTGTINRLLHAPQFSCGFDRFLLGARLQMASFRTSDNLIRALHGSSFPIQVQLRLGSSSPIHWRVASSGTSAIDCLLHAPHFSCSSDHFLLGDCLQMASFRTSITSFMSVMAHRSPSKRNSSLARRPQSIGELPTPTPASSIAFSMLRSSPAALIASFSMPVCKWPPFALPITSSVPFIAPRSPSKHISALACCLPLIGESPPPASVSSISSSMLHISHAAPIASFSVPTCKWPPSAPLITSSVPFMARRSPSKNNTTLARRPLSKSPPSAPTPSIASSMLRTSPAASIALFSVPACKWPLYAPPITSTMPFMAHRSPSKRNSALARRPPSISELPPSAPVPLITSSMLRTSPAALIASWP